MLLFLDTPSVQSDSGGFSLELYAILGAVLGGCSLRGGEGTAVGMVLGAMVLPVLENLVNFRGDKSDVIPAVIGLTLLFGTIVDELIRRRSQATLTPRVATFISGSVTTHCHSVGRPQRGTRRFSSP